MAYAPWNAGVIQFGREATPGTAVAATVIWRGEMASIRDERMIQETPEHLGIMAPTFRTVTTWKGASLAFPETVATFEQIPHIFEGAIKAATPSGAGPYTRAYPFPVAATANTLKYLTIETGNKVVTDENAEMEYSYCTDFTLSGSADPGTWMIASNWRGRQRTGGITLTGALSAPAVEDMLFPSTTLYIDATGGTMGTTSVAGVLRSAEISVNTGNREVRTAEGNQYFYAVKPHAAPPEITFSLQMELESGSVVNDERAIFESQAFRLIQLSIAGTSSRSCVISMAGRYTAIGDFTNADGNTVVTLEGKCAYSSADTEFFDITVINNVASL